MEKPVMRLVGEDGNAFAILGRMGQAMQKAGWSKDSIDATIKEATSGDYDHLLRTVTDTCEIDTTEDDA